jgi:hypothetical protein
VRDAKPLVLVGKGVTFGRPFRAVALAIPLLHACAASDADGPGAVTATDSAGVRIVVNHVAPDDVPRYTLDAPRLVFGEAFGEAGLRFHGVTSADVDDDGRIVVGDGGNHTIKAFSAEGEPLFAVGGSGQGPGELEAVTGAAWDAAGGIVAFDAQLSRVTRWDADGELVATVAVPPLPSGQLDFMHLDDDARALAVRYESQIVGDEPLVVGRWRSDAVAVRLDESLEPGDTLAVFPGEDRHYFPKDGHDRARFTIPLFAARPVFAFHDGCVYAVVAEAVSIGVFCDPADGMTRRFDWPEAPLQLTRAAFAAAGAETFRRRTGLEVTPDQLLRDYPMDVPPSRPAAGGMLVDAHGNVWLAEFFEADAPARAWWVFDADGGLVARIDFPRVHRLLWIGADKLVALQRDELDVERIAVYDVPTDK